MRVFCRLVAVPLILIAAGLVRAEDSRASLIVEGGGLPPNCPALKRLVVAATIKERIRIGYLATASSNPVASAKLFRARMSNYGVAPEQIQVIDITVQNSAKQAENPEVVAQIRDCTAIFFGGGDQTRITRALRKPDGTSTAALQAIYDARDKGVVIAGTSAGAAVQSEVMISVSGFPDSSIDDGLDPLDFGLTKAIEQPARRGLLVSRGLGFLKDAVIDQHFSQYRGRLGRLARATIEQNTRYGIGIDEDAAIVVDVDGRIEVLGPGHVTIVDAQGAKCEDGPLGCSISGVHLTCLGSGDRFDPKTGRATIHPEKKPTPAGQESYNGNFLIPDIAARGAALDALFAGVGNNTSRSQIGITLKHHRHSAHGYRHSFTKTDHTQGYKGILNGQWEESVIQVRLDIEPITQNLRSPKTAMPRDLPSGPARKPIETLVFRGVMLTDESGLFRPEASITRAELASAIAQTIRLELPRESPAQITDVPPTNPAAHEIALVVNAGLMSASSGTFGPEVPISRQEAAAVFVRLMERYRSVVLSAKPVEFNDATEIAPVNRNAVFAAHHEHLLTQSSARIRPTDNLTRAETAEAIFKIIGFPWVK